MGALQMDELLRPATLAAAGEALGPIDRVDLVVVRVPFVEPFGTSVAAWSVKEALLLRLEQDGLEGWGECVADPDPYYDGETTVSARYLIKDFLLQELTPARSLLEVLDRFRRVRGNPMAKATVENALLDLLARRRGIPLHDLLGYPGRPIPSGLSIGIQDSVEALLAKVAAGASQGYHRVKLKVMHGKDVEWVKAVRERFPDLALMVDANGDYTLEDSGHLGRLDDFGLTMIEQPLGYHDIYQHSLLQPHLRTRLCLDESIHSLDDAAAALDGAVCGSRPVIDQGWLPLSRQVGKSGLNVKPKLYIAAGISGAPEHVEGIKGSELIIAINSDARAPIFHVAHYGIVGDALDVLPALTEQVKAAKG